MNHQQTLNTCPVCDGDRIITGKLIRPVHDGRLFHDVGQCEDCGAWMIHDGLATSDPQVVTRAELALMVARGEAR